MSETRSNFNFDNSAVPAAAIVGTFVGFAEGVSLVHHFQQPAKQADARLNSLQDSIMRAETVSVDDLLAPAAVRQAKFRAASHEIDKDVAQKQSVIAQRPGSLTALEQTGIIVGSADLGIGAFVVAAVLAKYARPRIKNLIINRKVALAAKTLDADLDQHFNSPDDLNDEWLSMKPSQRRYW